MPTAYVCTCGKISPTSVCEKCAKAKEADKYQANLKYNRAKNASSYYRTKHWRKLSAECKRRDGNRCVACGSDKRVVAHHISSRDNSVSQPTPQDRIGNLTTLCYSCHSRLEGYIRSGKPSALGDLVAGMAY